MSSLVSIRVSGLTEALTKIRQISASGTTWGSTRIVGGAGAVYAYGIETGFRKSGALARRAGGAYMFKKGIEQIKPLVRTAITAAIPEGPGAIAAAASQLAVRLQNAVQAGTPVVSGNLRQSVFGRVE